MRSGRFESAARLGDAPQIYEEIPAVIRNEFNADTERDTIVRMRYLARKKRMSRPDITDGEMADYLALAENSPNFAHWITARRSAPQNPFRSNAVWLTAAAITFGLLTALLVMAIAITV